MTAHADMPCTARIGTDATHCWHQLPFVYTTNPPISVWRCCFCGIEKREQEWNLTIGGGHGRYVP